MAVLRMAVCVVVVVVVLVVEIVDTGVSVGSASDASVASGNAAMVVRTVVGGRSLAVEIGADSSLI